MKGGMREAMKHCTAMAMKRAESKKYFSTTTISAQNIEQLDWFNTNCKKPWL